MADYPSYPQLTTTKRVTDDGTVVERADSGKPRFRTFYTQVRYAFQVEHELDGTDRDAVWTHYGNERLNNFNFVWKGDNQTYTVRYASPPVDQPLPGEDRWRVTTYLVVV